MGSQTVVAEPQEDVPRSMDDDSSSPRLRPMDSSSPRDSDSLSEMPSLAEHEDQEERGNRISLSCFGSQSVQNSKTL